MTGHSAHTQSDSDNGRSREDKRGRTGTPRFHPWRLTFGMLATAFAWFVQMYVGELLTANACALSDPRHPAAEPSWVLPAVIALSGACLLLGVAGVAVAWRNVFFMRAKRRRPLDARARRVAELEWFLATVSALCSAMFMFGLIATDLAVVVVSPCGQW
jgi:hypothetical protein